MRTDSIKNIPVSVRFVVLGVVAVIIGIIGIASDGIPQLCFPIGTLLILNGLHFSLWSILGLICSWALWIDHAQKEASKYFPDNRSLYNAWNNEWYGAIFAVLITVVLGFSGYALRRKYGGFQAFIKNIYPQAVNVSRLNPSISTENSSVRGNDIGEKNLEDRLKTLADIHGKGLIDDDEYKAAKAKLLSENT